MQFDFSADDAVVSLSGEFTFSDHTSFRDMVARLLRSKGDPLVIDLSRLEFIDSAGLGMMLIARDEAAKAARALVLRGARGHVERMFSVTKFETLFTLEA